MPWMNGFNTLLMVGWFCWFVQDAPRRVWADRDFKENSTSLFISCCFCPALWCSSGWFGEDTRTHKHAHAHRLWGVMLGLSSMLSGACACSVAVVKSLKMGAHTHRHSETSARRLIFSIFRGVTFVWLPQGFVTASVQHYSWRATFFFYLFLSFFIFKRLSFRSYTGGALDRAAIGRRYHMHGNVKGVGEMVAIFACTCEINRTGGNVTRLERSLHFRPGNIQKLPADSRILSSSCRGRDSLSVYCQVCLFISSFLVK